jgi:hypothetical protein
MGYRTLPRRAICGTVATPLGQKPKQSVLQLFSIPDFTFPHNQRLPSKLLQSCLIPLITVDISHELWSPIILAALRHAAAKSALRIIVSVPVAAVHKNYLASALEYDVGLPRKAPVMQSVSEAE